jgi:hypothetical protein
MRTSEKSVSGEKSEEEILLESRCRCMNMCCTWEKIGFPWQCKEWRWQIHGHWREQVKKKQENRHRYKRRIQENEICNFIWELPLWKWQCGMIYSECTVCNFELIGFSWSFIADINYCQKFTAFTLQKSWNIFLSVQQLTMSWKTKVSEFESW